MQTTIVGQKCLLVHPETKKILVLLRSDYKKDGGTWDFIGWSAEFGENIVDAIKREAMEETWIILDIVRPRDLHSRMIGEDRWFVFNLRVCEDWHFAQDTIVLSNEHTEWKRVDRDTFKTLPIRQTVGYVQWPIKQFIETIL
jgi:8-oxo-dGTP pyrophosphatase MutT (NUDIX family)